MLDSTSSGYGDESPILNKRTKEVDVQCHLSLEEIHQRLLKVLKSTPQLTQISKKEMKAYSAQVQKANPKDPRDKWILMKVRGLLQYILKKRKDFHYSLAKGEITIYEKSVSQPVASVNVSAQTPRHHNRTCSDCSLGVPSNLLTNNNFLSVDAGNYSEDLFGETVESLHSFSQENYKILKSLTSRRESNDAVFKVPLSVDKIEVVEEIHESMEQEYSSIVQAPSTSHVKSEKSDLELKAVKSINFNDKVFEDLTITNNELKAEFAEEIEFVENWVTDLVRSLIHLEVGDVLNCSVELQSLNESTSNDTVPIKPYYSEENFKIIRDVCTKFRENLKKEMETNKDLQILNELINL